MKKSAWRIAVVTITSVILAGCGNKETKEALEKSANLASQKQYYDANHVLVEALEARDKQISDKLDTPADTAANDAIRQKIQSDAEVLKLERAQIPLYLRLERADMASTVYADILAGHPGDTVVYDALKSKDPQIRIGAARILGLVGKPDAIDALIATTKDSDQEVRRASVAALGAIKDEPKTVPPLIDALGDSYWFVRSEAATALGQQHDGRAVRPLLNLISDPDTTVQTSAESALVFLSKEKPSHASPDDFAGHLTDPNPKVVLVSAVCLAILKDARCIPVLTKLLDSNDPIAQLDAVKGLGETGDPTVIPTLRQTLKNAQKDTANKIASAEASQQAINMEGWSIIGLGNLKDQDSLADLQAIAGDNAEPGAIRTAAAAAVKKITGQNSELTEP